MTKDITMKILKCFKLNNKNCKIWNCVTGSRNRLDVLLIALVFCKSAQNVVCVYVWRVWVYMWIWLPHIILLPGIQMKKWPNFPNIVGDTSYVGLERLNIILQPGTILWISIMILTYTISALHADLCNIFLCNLSLWNI